MGGILYRGLRKSEKDGVDGGEDPPVPIPNTEVKLTSVENTWLATAWEDRKTPSREDGTSGLQRSFLFSPSLLTSGREEDILLDVANG